MPHDEFPLFLFRLSQRPPIHAVVFFYGSATFAGAGFRSDACLSIAYFVISTLLFVASAVLLYRNGKISH